MATELTPRLSKAVVKVIGGSRNEDEIEVLFNPTEYSVEYSATFSETAPPGLSNPILQFVNGNSDVLTMDLFFDTYTNSESADVSIKTKQFTSLVDIDAEIHAPPQVEFRWGTFHFTAVVEQVSQRFTMFTPDGTPVRATLSVTFKQYRTIAQQLDEPRLESVDRTKRRVLESHDSIWLMAHREYGEVKFWRLIAWANRIENPRRIEPGTVLVLPSIEDFRDLEVIDGN
jgi:hypothetical protein